MTPVQQQQQQPLLRCLCLVLSWICPGKCAGQQPPAACGVTLLLVGSRCRSWLVASANCRLIVSGEAQVLLPCPRRALSRGWAAYPAWMKSAEQANGRRPGLPLLCCVCMWGLFGQPPTCAWSEWWFLLCPQTLPSTPALGSVLKTAGPEQGR